MSYHLFLDDERKPDDVTWIPLPKRDWQIARSYEDFVRFIKKHGVPAFVSFDHDLSYQVFDSSKSYKDIKERTGRDCAHFLCEFCFEKKAKIPDYAVHSMNPVGAENITSIMESAKKIQGRQSN